jgi:hypothetical protein
MNKNIIRITIGIKLLISIVFLISLFMIGIDQQNLGDSGFPENQDVAVEKEMTLFRVLILLLPIVVSIFIDIKEQKVAMLKGRWYLLTSLLIVFYVIVNQLKGHYAALILAVVLTISLALIIRKQRQFIGKELR